MKVGGKGKAAAHAAYISREGKYSGRERYEDLEATGYGNMPKWAAHNPDHFWNAADEHERANGATYREIEVALPRELTPEQRRELVEDFIQQELGERHAYQWAIHTPKAALEGGDQPHAHIMYSERARDGIDRDPAQYFKRYNTKAPEKGGCRKDSAGTEERLQATRERWASVQNAHLERHGHAVRVDHRSLDAQGIDRAPEKHLGGRGVRQLQEADISALLERRAAEGERERAQRQVSSVIDLSGDLAAAKAERDSQKRREMDSLRAEAAKQREEAARARANRTQGEIDAAAIKAGQAEKPDALFLRPMTAPFELQGYSRRQIGAHELYHYVVDGQMRHEPSIYAAGRRVVALEHDDRTLWNAAALATAGGRFGTVFEGLQALREKAHEIIDAVKAAMQQKPRIQPRGAPQIGVQPQEAAAGSFEEWQKKQREEAAQKAPEARREPFKGVEKDQGSDWGLG